MENINVLTVWLSAHEIFQHLDVAGNLLPATSLALIWLFTRCQGLQVSKPKVKGDELIAAMWLAADVELLPSELWNVKQCCLC
jgi:hypothetical protein